MLQKSLMSIFWGLVLIVVDIKLNDFDLLFPDFLGYILIYGALVTLAQVSPRFGIAKPYAAAMVIVSIVEMMHINPFSIVSTLGIVLDFLMIWHACNGIIELALQRRNISLLKKRNLYSKPLFRPSYSANVRSSHCYCRTRFDESTRSAISRLQPGGSLTGDTAYEEGINRDKLRQHRSCG